MAQHDPSQEAATPSHAAFLWWVIGMARIASLIPRIPDPLPSPVKVALLGRTLPSLHLLSLVGVLDGALSDYIDEQEIPWPKGKRRDLFNHIEVIAATQPGINADRLHHLRRTRNAIAHIADVRDAASITWESLDDSINAVVEALFAIDCIDRKPTISAFFERNPTFFPKELGPSGERIRQAYRIGAKSDDEVFIQFEHEVLYHPPSARDIDEQPRPSE